MVGLKFNKVFAFIALSFLLIIAGCKKTQKIDKQTGNPVIIIDTQNKQDNTKILEEIKKPKEVLVNIFVHGTYPAGIRTIFKRFMYVPRKLTLITDLKSKYHYIYMKCTKLSKINPVEFPINTFYTVGWSGQLSSDARLEGSKLLYEAIKELINKYKNENLIPKIRLITHSHGGNVALNLAKIKNENDNIKIDQLILLGTPIQEETKEFCKDKIFNKVYNIYSSMDWIQLADPQGLHEVNQGKETPLFSQRRLHANNQIKQAKIKVNDRGIFHEEMLLPSFLQILPKLIETMDKIDDSNQFYLIKCYKSNKEFKIIDQNQK